MENATDSLFKRHPLVMYFVLAFIFTWLILSPGVASTLSLLDFQFDGTILTILSGLGPLLAAILVTRANDGSEGVRKIFLYSIGGSRRSGGRRRSFYWRVCLH